MKNNCWLFIRFGGTSEHTSKQTRTSLKRKNERKMKLKGLLGLRDHDMEKKVLNGVWNEKDEGKKRKKKRIHPMENATAK